jgi:dTDP-D-glucose 4,6-dehydratase
MLQSKLPSGAYNVGTGIATEVLNLYNIIKNIFNIDYDLQKKFLNKTSKHDMSFYANTNKFKKYFNNFEFEKINSGLYKTVKYFKENY